VRRLLVLIATIVVAAPVAAGAAPGRAPERSGAIPPGYTRTIQNAIVDVQAFWKKQFPKVYGKKYDPVPTDRIIAAHPGIKLPKCQGHTLNYANVQQLAAFYCFRSNFVAYDDAGILPALYRKFGRYSVAMVFAHEFGHAVQDRAGNAGQVSLLKELQADCFAGSFTRTVSDHKITDLPFAGGALDRSLAALLALRDTPGSSPDDVTAHGSGFDRTAAFEQGFEDGASKCATYFDSPPVTTEMVFANATDAATGGNLPAAEVLPTTVNYLNQFYAAVEPAYRPLTLSNVVKFDGAGPESQFPTCGGSHLPRKQIRNRVFYCISDGYIAFDEPYLQHVYDDIGDYGVATLFANTWATYVQTQQRFPGVQTNEINAVLGADCYTGGFSAFLFNQKVLSSGDLDETVQALADYASSRGVSSKIDVTFLQLHAFRDGFFNGYQVCQSSYANAKSSGEPRR
jgi:predicted metalloprotease